MKQPSPLAEKAIASMKKSVAKALDRKQRLGQYAVVWRDGKVVRLQSDQIKSLAVAEDSADYNVKQKEPETVPNFTPDTVLTTHAESLPPILTSWQESIHGLLLERQTDKYPLADWYLGAIYALAISFNPDRYSQAAQSLRELLEKLPGVSITENLSNGKGGNLKQQRDYIDERFQKDKEKVKGEGVWKGKVISSHMDKTLCKLEDYLERNKQPKSSEVSFKSISDADPMADYLSKEIIERKWQRFIDVWRALQGVAHHKTKVSNEEFRRITVECEQIILDAFAPVAAEGQLAIHNIVTLESPTESDMEKALELMSKSGANYVYFWKTLNSKQWLPFLEKHQCFKMPPKNESVGGGYLRSPIWQPLLYLGRILNDSPESIIELICNFEDTDNSNVMREIVEIAVNVENIEHSLRLYKWVEKYLKQDDLSIAEEPVIRLLKRWSVENDASREFAIKLTKKIVFFKPDSRTEEKIKREKEVPGDDFFYEPIQPKPIFDEWAYQEILREGVRSVAEQLPLETSRILASATSKFLELSYPNEIGTSNDYSESWCYRVDHNDRLYKNAENELINTLTFACELIYEKQPEKIAEIDNILHKKNWLVFKRIRQHLYAKFPDKAQKEWIQEFIRENDRNYGEKTHHYEFQRMLRSACETYAHELFEEGELQGYLDAILTGPNEQKYMEWYKGWNTEAPPEGAFTKYKAYFYRNQLRPFTAVLYGEYKEFYEKLDAEADKDITDDDYHPTPLKSGTVGFRSPKSIREMEAMPDDELFNFLEEWDDPQHIVSTNEEPVYVNHSALAAAFKQYFLNVISQDNERVRWWLKKGKMFSRPIFCGAIVNALSELIESKQHEQMDDYFDFCDWVLSHEDTVPQTSWHEKREDADPKKESWSSSRSAVRSFAVKCISKKTELSQEWRERVFALYRQLCTGKDSRLESKENDKGKHNARSLVSTAINNTRSQALEDLFDYANWVRRAVGTNCEVPEVTEIVKKRLSGNPPLTDAEHALLAMHFGNLRRLNRALAEAHVHDIFDKQDTKLWQACFSAYLTHSRNYWNDFDYLKQEYLHAFKTVTIGDETNDNEDDGYTIIRWSGYHLLTLYFTGRIELESDSDLCLQLFYKATKNKKKLWGDLFNHTGRSLGNWGSDVNVEVVERVKKLFKWRFKQAEPQELSEYLPWLDGECLEPKWRMKGLLKTLPFLDDEDVKASMITDTLNKHFLTNYPDKTVECFSKVVKAAKEKPYFYVRKESAIPILKVGLASQNSKTKAFAEEARENLLKRGRFEYLHLEGD